MTFEPDSDNECITCEDNFCSDNLIQHSINDGLYLVSKGVKENSNESLIVGNYIPISSTSSEVEYTLTFDCRFKCGSFDQIGCFSFNAKARKSISLGYIGINERASGKNCLYSCNGMNSINIARSLLNSLNFSSDGTF